jgi:hypothetical protein
MELDVESQSKGRRWEGKEKAFSIGEFKEKSA